MLVGPPDQALATVTGDDEPMRTAWPLNIEDLTPEALQASGPTHQDIAPVFLRHRGCRVVLIHQGSDAEFDRTLRPLWPDADAVSDPEARFHASWSVERGLA